MSLSPISSSPEHRTVILAHADTHRAERQCRGTEHHMRPPAVKCGLILALPGQKISVSELYLGRGVGTCWPATLRGWVRGIRFPLQVPASSATVPDCAERPRALPSCSHILLCRAAEHRDAPSPSFQLNMGMPGLSNSSQALNDPKTSGQTLPCPHWWCSPDCPSGSEHQPTVQNQGDRGKK